MRWNFPLGKQIVLYEANEGIELEEKKDYYNTITNLRV